MCTNAMPACLAMASSLAYAAEQLAYPADKYSPWRIIIARVAAPFVAGGLFVWAPLVDRTKRLRPLLSWARGDPIRFQIWLFFFWWPFCNLRRVILGILLPGRPACLHVQLSASSDCAPVAELSRELPARPGAGTVRLCVISDTHGQHALLTSKIPRCDILFHCGDIMTEDRGCKGADGGRGAVARLEDVGRWLASLPCAVAVLIGGNHDSICQDIGAERVREALRRGAERAEQPRADVQYLSNDAVELQGLRIFGTPLNAANTAASLNRAFQPPFGAGADDPRLREAANLPPGRLDVLLTHGPPAGALDAGLGVPLFREIVRRERPALHLFGHQHLAYGVAYDPNVGTLFVNASCCDGLFAPLHPPIVIDAPRARLYGSKLDDASAVGSSASSAAQRMGGFQLSTAAGARICRSPWTLGMRRVSPFTLADCPPVNSVK